MIPVHIRASFDPLISAAENGDLVLVECSDAATGMPRYVLAAVHRDELADYVVTPFGHLAEGNPYEAYRPLK